MKREIFKYSLVLLLALNLNAEDTYTVDELILKALENSPDLKISSSQLEASKSRTDIASASYLPEIDLHLNAGEISQSDIPTNPDDMVSDSLILGNLSLKQIIYDFGKTDANVDSFKYETDASSLGREQKISDKKRDVKVAYYNVLKAIALIKVNKENVKLNKIQLYRSQKYFDAGIRTRIDISDAKVELIKSRLELRNSEYDLKIAYTALDKEIGFKEINNDYKVFSKDLDLKNLYSSLNDYSLNLNDSIGYAYKNKYELKKYMVNIESAKAKKELAGSEYYPSLYFSADYTAQSIDEFKNSIPQNSWQASINLDWNIYKGGETDAATQERKIQVELSHLEYQNSKLSIKKIATEAYINVYKAKDSVELSQSLVEVSNEKFDQASKRYKYGLSDYIELQQSRQGYIDSMATLVVKYYDFYQSIAYLDNAIGK